MKTVLKDAVDQKDLSRRVQKLVKSVTPNSSTNDKANAALALSAASLLSAEQEDTLARQLLKLLKDLQR